VTSKGIVTAANNVSTSEISEGDSAVTIDDGGSGGTISFGKRHIAQHPCQAGDQPGLFNPPGGQDRGMGVGGRHGRRPRVWAFLVKGPSKRMREARKPLPNLA
jgi:hypothetical protein